MRTGSVRAQQARAAGEVAHGLEVAAHELRLHRVGAHDQLPVEHDEIQLVLAEGAVGVWRGREELLAPQGLQRGGGGP